jgi:stage II sporulation protein AB (anti-sigma F factor)
MKPDNAISIIMDAQSQNEAFARIAAAAFITPLDPTVAELTEIKTAVSEAVTNAIIHGYNGQGGKIYINCEMTGGEVSIEILDKGIGIENIPLAREPLYTSKPDMDRSGMGFTIMETFMDTLSVSSEKNKGTSVVMTKKITRGAPQVL